MTKAINLKRKKARKKQKVVDRQKTGAIAKKKRKNKEGNSLSIKNNGYYNNNPYI